MACASCRAPAPPVIEVTDVVTPDDVIAIDDQPIPNDIEPAGTVPDYAEMSNLIAKVNELEAANLNLQRQSQQLRQEAERWKEADEASKQNIVFLEELRDHLQAQLSSAGLPTLAADGEKDKDKHRTTFQEPTPSDIPSETLRTDENPKPRASKPRASLSFMDVDEDLAAFDKGLGENEDDDDGSQSWTDKTNSPARLTRISFRASRAFRSLRSSENTTLQNSALVFSAGVQFLIYLAALGGVVFTLVATSEGWGVEVVGCDDDEHRRRLAAGAAGCEVDEHHRRLGGGPSQQMIEIAFCFVCAGLVSFLMHLLKQPLILGYLLGGVLVGPIGLNIVPSHDGIESLSSLGLIFLLFMIGLELNLRELLKLGKVVIVTGCLQYPICAGCMIAVFTGLESMGLSFGNGKYAAMYIGMTCGISSTMIVVKLLADTMQADSQPGRLTVGILIFQDIWAIVILAVQPDLASPEIVGILKTFAFAGVLILFGVFYAKFVMPVVFLKASNAVELMLVVSLAWCFFIGCFAILPWFALSLELAALIGGVVLASFPYSNEFNGKIKYIRDFFIVLFFVGLGMRIPVPTLSDLATAVVIASVVVIFRWLGIFLIVYLLGGGGHLACIATLNLSQISEFALVIVSLGSTFEHVENDTMTILIWAFSFLAVSSSYVIGFNHKIFTLLSAARNKLFRVTPSSAAAQSHEEHHGEHRDIVMLGFYKIASAMVSEIELHSPALLKRMHVINFDVSIVAKLKKKGITCAYGDISSKDVLEHCHHGEAAVVMSTVPDSMLAGVTNLEILKNSLTLWPSARVIVTSDTMKMSEELYAAGATYVLSSSLLCGRRLQNILTDFCSTTHGGELEDLFRDHQHMDTTAADGTGKLKPRKSLIF